MLIEGPMNITIAEPAYGQALAILFTPEFQTLEERIVIQIRQEAQAEALLGLLSQEVN